MIENQTANAANLAELRSLFRDDDAFSEFVGFMRNAFQHDFFAFFENGELLGSALSPAATQTVICERMVDRVRKRPALISELTRRLQEDEIVD